MKLALWQTVGFPGDLAANLSALESSAGAAAAAGAALLLCPESWLCGYNIGSAVAELAESREGPAAQRIATIAREHRIAIAYGYAERAAGSEQIFNAAQFIAADGSLLSHYRKTHLFGPAERAAYRPGESLPAIFTFQGLRCALLICYDIEFPETARCLALAGAEVLFVPTAQTQEYGAVTQTLIPARCIENQLHIAYCNHAGIENGLQFLGGSCLVGPEGQSLLTAGSGEALLVGEISAAARTRARELYPYLADRRPALYAALSR